MRFIDIRKPSENGNTALNVDEKMRSSLGIDVAVSILASHQRDILVASFNLSLLASN